MPVCYFYAFCELSRRVLDVYVCSVAYAQNSRRQILMKPAINLSLVIAVWTNCGSMPQAMAPHIIIPSKKYFGRIKKTTLI